MREERRTILALIALGRLSPGEAERLLAVTERRREDFFWLAIACLVLLCEQPQFAAIAAAPAFVGRLLRPETLGAVGHAFITILHSVKGML